MRARQRGRTGRAVIVAGSMALWAGVTAHMASGPDQTPAPAAKTVWDAVYSEAQAARGKEVYTKDCERCHGATLTGKDDASPLTGAMFMTNWKDETLAALFEKIQSSMPDDKPGSLTKEQSIDAVSYILSFNKFPAGADELKADKDILKTIKITAKKQP